MVKRTVATALTAAVLLVSHHCEAADTKKKPAPQNFEVPALEFRIKAISSKQKLTKLSPYHAAGGTWSIYDCETKGTAPAQFQFGISDDAQREMLCVPDRANGAKFVNAFCSAFKTKVPTKQKSSALPLVFPTAVLGTDLVREKPGGGFSGSHGGWTATKIFLDWGNDQAEAFLNFNEKQKQGEFSEKDEEYKKMLSEVFASHFRD